MKEYYFQLLSLFMFIKQKHLFFRLRAAYGKNILQNAVHGSSTAEHADVTVKKIFGDLKFAPDGTVIGIPFLPTFRGWHVHGDPFFNSPPPQNKKILINN